MSICKAILTKRMGTGSKFVVFALVAVKILLVGIIYNRPKLYKFLKGSPADIRVIYGNDGTWFNFTSDIFRLYAYSAIYDDRPTLLSDPVIRITAVSDPIENLKALNITQLYCTLHNDSTNITLHMVDEPKPIGFGWGLNKQRAKEYLYTCPTVKGMIPKSVSISTAQDEFFPSGVPVTVPNKPKNQRDFCICPQAAYGRLDPYRLIEWMELQKILGVSLVEIHVLSATASVLNVFGHYANEGFVELRKMNYIYASANDTEKEFWLHLTPAINDCIYRHMYEFRRIAIMDFDEFIMPRYQQNLSELVTYLDQKLVEKKSLKVNYAFRNNYFFLNLPPDDNISPYLTVLRFRRKVPVSPEGYSVKSIINPQACTRMHNHLCWGLTANYSAYGNTASVDPGIALNQHYKKCHFSKKECDVKLKNSTQDDVMLRLKDILTKNVREKVKVITGKEV